MRLRHLPVVVSALALALELHPSWNTAPRDLHDIPRAVEVSLESQPGRIEG